jgi:hypothetical protein
MLWQARGRCDGGADEMPLGYCLFSTYSVGETGEIYFTNRSKLSPAGMVIGSSNNIFFSYICIESNLEKSHYFLQLPYPDTSNINSLCISRSIPLIPGLPLSPYHQPISNHPTPPLPAQSSSSTTSTSLQSGCGPGPNRKSS